MLYDYRGNPIETKKLQEELAAPELAGVRGPWFDSVANTLTPEVLATVIASVDNNDIESFLTLAEEMEERDLHYADVLGTRKLAVTGLDAMVESVSDNERDVEIADAVRDVVEDDAFDAMLPGLLDALGKGFSVTEILWDRSGPRWTPREYKWRDPRHFMFDIETGSEIRLRDVEDLAKGLPLAPFKFLAHKPQIKMGMPIRGGLARLACVAYMLKGYTLKDWWAFMEVFGMPLRVGKYQDGATTEQKASLLRAVSSIGTDAACIISEKMVIDFVEASKTSGGDKLFIAAADWIDRQVSKGVLGQTMTTDDGSSLSQAKVHDQVRGDILVSDAKQASATIRRDLVKPFVDLNFGPQKKYPLFRLVVEESEDLEYFTKAIAPLIDRGLRVQASVVLDKFGLPEAEDGAELLVPEAVAAASSGGGGGVSGEPGAPPPIELPPEPATTAARKPTTVQTVILSKERFKTLEAAKKWVSDHDLHAAKVDETGTSYRFRQREPSEFVDGSFRTIELTTGVKAVIGVLKAQTAAARDEDTIDQLVEEALGGWRRTMNPVLNPILELAEKSTSYDEFLDGLEDAMAKVDVAEFTASLATGMFKARGLGDSTDDV